MSILRAELSLKTKQLEFWVAKKFKNTNINMAIKKLNAHKEEVKAIKSFMFDSLVGFGIPSDRMIITISSGLVGKNHANTTLLHY